MFSKQPISGDLPHSAKVRETINDRRVKALKDLLEITGWEPPAEISENYISDQPVIPWGFITADHYERILKTDTQMSEVEQ